MTPLIETYKLVNLCYKVTFPPLVFIHKSTTDVFFYRTHNDNYCTAHTIRRAGVYLNVYLFKNQDYSYCLLVYICLLHPWHSVRSDTVYLTHISVKSDTVYLTRISVRSDSLFDPHLCKVRYSLLDSHLRKVRYSLFDPHSSLEFTQTASRNLHVEMWVGILINKQYCSSELLITFSK